jgi:hypothetical protein
MSQPSAPSRGGLTTNPTARASRAAALAASASSKCASKSPLTKRFLSAPRGAVSSSPLMLTSAVSRPAGTDRQSTLRGQIRRQHTQPGIRRSRSIRVRISRRRLLRLSITVSRNGFVSIYRAWSACVFGVWKVPRFPVALPFTILHCGSRSFSECCVERRCHQALLPVRLRPCATRHECRGGGASYVCDESSSDRHASHRRPVGDLAEAGRSAARACGRSLE